MPTITHHKPVGILTNPAVREYELTIQDKPLFALKCWGIFAVTIIGVSFMLCLVVDLRGGVVQESANQSVKPSIIRENRIAPIYYNDTVINYNQSYPPVIHCPKDEAC